MSRKSMLLGSLLAFMIVRSFAQSNDSTSLFKFSSYVDAYYAYYTDSVGHGNFQQFPSVSPRTEEFGLNIALLSLQYDAEKVRGIVTLQYGDIPKSAWSASFNNIMEAHAGIRLLKWLWLDAGFFRTHFGTEGLLPKENLLSSIAINTFYEPYFESGARLQILAGKKFIWNIYGLNGYNIFEENNNKKSFGNLMTLALNDHWNFGYSNYIGDDTPDGNPVSHLRFHQNLFINYQMQKLKVQTGFDYCLQEHSDLTDIDKAGTMYSGVFGLKYQFNEKFALAGRGEYFNDPQGYMSVLFRDKSGELTGYKLWGATVGIEFKPTPDSYFRIEGRKLQMDENQEIFFWKGKNRSDRMEVSGNIGISF
jgi:hypothetical protein